MSFRRNGQTTLRHRKEGAIAGSEVEEEEFSVKILTFIEYGAPENKC